ncbi:unnamed protein product, partial [Linum tenue]
LLDGDFDFYDRSVKTFTYESLHNIVRLINGVSGMLLTVLPGKANVLEGLHGWELRPSFRGPRLPYWMENGVSSFNKFVHELSVDSDSDTASSDYSSAEEDDGMYPASPSSHSSRVSNAMSFRRNNGRSIGWFAFIFSWVIMPLKILLGVPPYLYGIFFTKESTTYPLEGSHQGSQSAPINRVQSRKDHFIHHATDRRRGVIEDLHLGIEISIEAVFDFFHKATQFLLSPTKILKATYEWFSYDKYNSEDISGDVSNTSVPASTLGDTDPVPRERKATTQGALNTDARTCQDVITELGYPYEAIRVITSDGYVLLLERIPRRDSRKAVYLQHGVMDSSMGWVSNGVVGSPAFAAYDQGYDVFLGNLRGLVSREHIDKNISSRQYWRYSINEHGMEDIPAMVEKIHDVKTTELKISGLETEEENNSQPYKLCAICHSLGGAAMLMYVVTRRIEEKPHRLSRLILLSPAGFHQDSNLVFTAMEHLFLMMAPILCRIIPAFYIPTRFFRMLLNKLARDFNNYPAVGGLVQTLMSYVVGGDSSNWVGVLGLPHYNMNDMPGVSFFVALHLAQMKHARKFRMYDYGSPAANMEFYGSPEPLDLGEYYGFIDIPVDLVAGKRDNVIRPSMVIKHYKLMKGAGVDVSYNEFEYAHLDFTFSHREELLAYVMSRMLLLEGGTKQQLPSNQKSLKLKKKEKVNS